MNRDELQAYLEQQAIRELIEKLLGILFSPITLGVVGLLMFIYFFYRMILQWARAEKLHKRKEAAEAEALPKAEEEEQIIAEGDAKIAELKAEKEFLSVFLFGDSLECRMAVGLTKIKVFEGKKLLNKAHLTKVELSLEGLSFEIAVATKRTLISYTISRDLTVSGVIRQKPNKDPLSSYSFDGELNKEQLLEEGEILIDHPEDNFKICFFL